VGLPRVNRRVRLLPPAQCIFSLDFRQLKVGG